MSGDGATSMSDDGATSTEIRDQLELALGMTDAVLAGVVTPDGVRELLAKRGPLLAAAFAAKKRGAPWGEVETALARRIMTSDKELVSAMWQPRKDAFSWLVARRETVAVEMPHISALAAAHTT